MTPLELYEEKLREFDFSWRYDAWDDRGEWNEDGWADEMTEREWGLLIEAERLGEPAMRLWREYRYGRQRV